MSTNIGLITPNGMRDRVIQGSLPSSADDIEATTVIQPTSFSYGGISASLNGNGTVTMTSVGSLSMNGVFTSAYKNYIIIGTGVNTSTTAAISLKFRSSGTDATISTFARHISSGSTSGRATGANTAYLGITSIYWGGFTVFVFNPNQASAKAFLSSSAYGMSTGNNVDYAEYATLLNSSSTYDGFTIFATSGVMTGQITVYGIKS